jgi:CHAT domain-containing protein/Tfp pilus assembly protein PilF
MKNSQLGLHLYVSLFFLLFINGAVFSQPAQTILPVKETLTKEMNGGESHWYKIQSGDSYYLRVVVEQKGIDVIVTLYDSTKNKLTEIANPNGTQGAEILSYIIEKSGDYLIEVKSPAKESPKGIYLIELEKLNPVTEQNRNLFQADQLFFEAEQWKIKRTPESIQNALRKYPEAEKYYQFANDKLGEATVLNNFGELIIRAMPAQAESNFRKALQTFEIFKSQANLATVASNLGAALNAQGKTEESIGFYEKAANLFNQLKDSASEATVRSNLGKSLSDIGKTDLALAEFEKALEIFKVNPNKLLEAITFNNMGALFSSTGRFQKAIESFQQVLPIFRAIKERRGEGIILNNLGSSYRKLGEFQNAKDYYLHALPILIEVGDKLNQAYLLANLGEVEMALGNWTEAQTNYTTALKLFQETKDRRGEAHVFAKFGVWSYSQKDYQEAIKYYLKSLPIREETADRPGEALTNLYLAESYFAGNDLTNAGERLKKALTLSLQVGDSDTQAKSLYNLSLVEEKSGNLSQARLNIEEAVKIIETNRAQIRSDELKTSYFALFQNFYQHYIHILMKSHQENPNQKFDEKAFEISERSRARSLADLLSESNVDIRQGVDSKLLEKEKLTRQKISAIAEKLFRLPQKTAEKDQLRLEKELSTQKINLEQISAEIKIKSPEYAALSQPQILSVTEIQNLLDENTVVLEYSLGDQQSYLWLVGKNQFKSLVLPAESEIETVAKKFYELLTSRQKQGDETDAQTKQRAEKSDSEYPKHSNQLSRILLAPIYPDIKNKRLLIVSDGTLQYLPFSALPIPADQVADNLKNLTPLMVNNEIVNLPSASLLSALLRTKRNTTSSHTIITFADAVFEENDARFKDSDKMLPEKNFSDKNKLVKTPGLLRGSGVELKRLSFSGDEATEIASLAPASNPAPILGFEANLIRVQSENFSQYRYVHFSTHGIFNTRQPELSGLVFSLFDKKGNPQNGFLGLSDIYNLKMPSEMVVLSACQTALGKDVRGEGLIGLTRGFMYAGSRRVVASLWKVEDDVTAQLMKRMYSKILKEKVSPASALRQAQIEMWKRKQNNHPYYWAGFTLQGDYR